MIQVEPIEIGGHLAVGVMLELPQTRVLTIQTRKGYLMCGLLAVDRLDVLHGERKIVAARVTGVRTLGDMLEARVDGVTAAARELGITEGMTGRETLERMV